MLRALGEFEIGGVPSLVGFHRALLSHPSFVAGETCHGLVESEELAEQAQRFSHQATNLAPAPDGSLPPQATRPLETMAEVDGRRVTVRVLVPEPGYRELARSRRERAASGAGGAGTDAVVSPMQGTVLDVKVAAGDAVETGHVICIVEAMKMENEVAAHRAGTVAHVSVAVGSAVTIGQKICVIESAEPAQPADSL